ncbi:winged helix-turn-helix domain-containing protein [Ruania halotolerans]|uniref:winged helix-turn-helix domain-containing protein n=1 Tax=Ruania halotolerans TaxID=2897773 RepID=UPI001E60552A|nr:helix-turn-helix domain-containing protein [Ruania halotolerans]UFU07326.1 helix-turn-helix domain-containing protein [Ruania halotolerans]
MRIDDPGAMRALAHPLRIELFERLAIEGTATASELAELVGATPANCSFHLRTLAKHGYIERVEGATGRDRPWRVVDIEQSWSAGERDGSDRDLAARALESSFLEWETGRLRRAAGRPTPSGWTDALTTGGATLHLTPEEAKDVSARIGEIVREYVPRWENPELRPEGGRPVRIFTATYLVEPATNSTENFATADDGTEDQR